MAGTKPRTGRGRFLFGVSEYDDGTPWISTEPRPQSVTFLNGAFIGFDLPQGTDAKRAQEIADFLNKNIEAMSVAMSVTCRSNAPKM